MSTNADATNADGTNANGTNTDATGADGTNADAISATGNGATGKSAAGAARASRRRLLLVSAAVAAVAGSVAAGTALAAGPTLPTVTAQSLLARALSNHQQTFAGTVQSTVDLGVPSQLVSQLPSALASAGGKSGAAGASGATGPQAQQTEQQLLSLLSGTHSFDVAVDGPNRQSFSSSDTGRTVRFVHNGTEAWTYDSQTNQAVQYTGIRPDEATTHPNAPAMTTPADAARMLQQIAPFSSVHVDGDSMVAGRQVYVLVVSPKGSGSTIGDVRLSVDAKTDMPLGLQVDPSDGSSPIADIQFTNISYTPPAASTFDFALPQGAELTTRAAAKAGAAHPGKPGEVRAPQAGQRPNPGDVAVLGSGWSTVYKLSPSAAAKGGKGGNPLGALDALKEVGRSVPGGTLFTTKLVNVLVTDNGTVYAGAVTPAYLESLAK